MRRSWRHSVSGHYTNTRALLPSRGRGRKKQALQGTVRRPEKAGGVDATLADTAVGAQSTVACATWPDALSHIVVAVLK